MIPSQHKTTKLFYNKWPYKLVLNHSRARYVRTYGPDAIILDCNSKNQKYHNELDTLDFAKRCTKYWDQEIQLRVENSTMSIFCKNEKLFYEMELDFAKWLREIHAPANRKELDFLMAQNKRRVVCNNLPYEKYKYRIAFKTTMDINLRQSFKTWIEKYGDKASITNHTMQWFDNGRSGYGWNPVMLIEDSATLSMALLFLGGNARYIEEFVLRSSININLEQDNTCQHSASPLNSQTIWEQPA